ncbi:tetratricopeptide repeat protein [Romeria aff. gracilis LEGE 07310]|uniref:Tetratricopeptide repeat protein n=1 Tax=Vasconcelosia minhoensis LEGE 07310 TaxID=915328 RepID=A0A8J7AAA5_9CYAN|nr:tetratricopeptide repeat protein [Romeria gracilis]MBE9077036.1 tetratricopeptide repeat protein [Romeria aff. gracilis LEGE 07310]
MNPHHLTRLLDALKAADEGIREQATAELWHTWFHQKGVAGIERLVQSQTQLNGGDVRSAEAELTALIQAQPDFAEAWNRRAVLYYIQQRYRDAIADCQMTLELVPYHFGALHGLGLSYMALGQYAAAIQSFRQALEIQPFASVNQRLILECTAQLS